MLNSIVALLESGAGGGGGAYESIATATGTGSSGTITFSSIPSTYASLQVRMISKDTAGTTGYYRVYASFNGDTGANYAYHWLEGEGTTASAGASTASNNIYAGIETRASETALGVAIFDIHDYTSTTKNKTTRSFAGFDTNGAGRASLYSGLWLNTAAITSISFTGVTAFSSNTSFALYGIKGA